MNETDQFEAPLILHFAEHGRRGAGSPRAILHLGFDAGRIQTLGRNDPKPQESVENSHGDLLLISHVSRLPELTEITYEQDRDVRLLVYGNGDRVPLHQFQTYSVDLQKNATGAIEFIQLLAENMRIRRELRAVKIAPKRDAETSSEELEFISLHDSLTGLPNRRSLMSRLDKVVGNGTQNMGCLIVNIDRFKVLNDRYGSETGDGIIVEVAKRLSRAVRHRDVVCRVTADEFTIIASLSSDEQLRQIAGRIHTSLTGKFQVGGQSIKLRVCVAAIMVSDKHQRSADLLRDASIAMSRAKTNGGNQIQFFDHVGHQQDMDNLEIETDLPSGLDRGEFMLHYQPIVSLDTGSVLGFEALMRWNHNTRGSISPAVFIPISEENGFIDRLGMFALETGCQQLQEWSEEVGERPLFVSINISRKQLLRPDFAAEVKNVIAATGVDPARLHFEITETAVVDRLEVVCSNLKELRDAGSHIVIDDFGVGYSSLSSLYRLPVDVLKIDRSFIARIGKEKNGADLVKAIIDISRALHLTLVAEGIETPEQATALIDLGCPVGQGFHYSPGVPAQAATSLLQTS